MTAYTSLPNSAVQPGGRPRGSTITALRDNLPAAFEGDATAVAAGVVVRDAALSTVVTIAGRDWVANRMALLPIGWVGTFALLRHDATPSSNTTIGPGTSVAGTSLSWANAAAASTGSTLGFGSWMCCGSCQIGPLASIPLSDGKRVTVFMRMV